LHFIYRHGVEGTLAEGEGKPESAADIFKSDGLQSGFIAYFSESIEKAGEQASVGRISHPPSGYFPAFMRSGLTAQACPLRVEIRPTGIRIKRLFNRLLEQGQS